MLTGITVGIGHAGLHFLYRTHGTQRKIQPRMLLASHKYSNVDKWVSDECCVFVFLCFCESFVFLREFFVNLLFCFG